MPSPFVAPPMSSKQVLRNETARRLGVSTRYIDIVLSRGSVPYALLAEHIRLGGATRRDALHELRKVIPAECLDWFDHIEKQELWSELRRCFLQNDSEDNINVRFLQATLAWIEKQRKSADASSNISNPAIGGTAGSSNDPP